MFNVCWLITDQMMCLKICFSSIVTLLFSGLMIYSRTIFRLVFYSAHIICEKFSLPVTYLRISIKQIDLCMLLFISQSICLYTVNQAQGVSERVSIEYNLCESKCVIATVVKSSSDHQLCMSSMLMSCSWSQTAVFVQLRCILWMLLSVVQTNF